MSPPLLKIATWRYWFRLSPDVYDGNRSFASCTTVGAIKHDRSIHASSAHIFRDRALESIALYPLCIGMLHTKFYHFRRKNVVLAAKIRNKLILQLPASYNHFCKNLKLFHNPGQNLGLLNYGRLQSLPRLHRNNAKVTEVHLVFADKKSWYSAFLVDKDKQKLQTKNLTQAILKRPTKMT